MLPNLISELGVGATRPLTSLRSDAPTLACARGADDGVRPYATRLVSGSGQLNPLPNILDWGTIVFLVTGHFFSASCLITGLAD